MHNNSLVSKALSPLLNPFRSKFEPSNRRSSDAALYFTKLRPGTQSDTVCPNTIRNDPNGVFEIVNTKDLKKYSASTKRLICHDMALKSFSEYKTCNFDATLPSAVSLQSDKLIML